MYNIFIFNKTEIRLKTIVIHLKNGAQTLTVKALFS